MFINMVIGLCWFFGLIVLIHGLGGSFKGQSQAFVNIIWGVIFIAVGYIINKWDTKTKI